ncbi:hypothetical protein C8R46DRAFT_278713 [Mycena filopes]|nr:hypothetical protein C8R46DRAFT_278713 [Mycena filopes]
MSNGASSWSSDSSSCWDDWPANFDGTGLFQSLLARDDPPIFRFDVPCVLREVEGRLHSAVVDIPRVGKGANYFGMHLRLANDSDVLVRLARRDVNWPRFTAEGNADEILELVERQVQEVQFESEVYGLLRSQPQIMASNLLYYRPPTYRPDTDGLPPEGILGRAFFVFQKTEGVNNVWPDDLGKRLRLLEQCARIRAALFAFVLPPDFIAAWFARRIPCAQSIPTNMIAPTRAFGIRLLAAKIHETIPDEGGLIGWAEDHTPVGPTALRAKKLLLRLLPLIMPAENQCDKFFYRLVLDHGDFGIHNMNITNLATVTSLYDWESAEIVPALFSEPQMSVYVDLELNADGVPAICRTWEGITEGETAECLRYAEHYFQTLGKEAPRYMQAIKAGKDARRIWYALRSWRGDSDAEEYFGALASWAEERMSEVRSTKGPRLSM